LYDDRDSTSNLTCERCRAGQMIFYERSVGQTPNVVTIRGLKCDRCGFVQLDDDNDVWSAVGL